MLISVHLPKTAGTSFRYSLEEHFASALKCDYDDFPINTPPFQRKSNALCKAFSVAADNFSGIQCIHGHFLPVKYSMLSLIKPLIFVTWMRDPVNRVISHYHFWKTHYPAVLPPLQARMIREKWSLERFCLGRELKDIYHQFLWGFPLNKFSFIGITEYYQDDFAVFARVYLGSELPVLTENRSLETKSTAVPESLRIAIGQHHEKDIALYLKALELRRQRMKE